jgi:hypothetical protein
VSELSHGKDLRCQLVAYLKQRFYGTIDGNVFVASPFSFLYNAKEAVADSAKLG